MPAQIIPIDPVDRALDHIVRLLPLSATTALDATFQQAPVDRMGALMSVLMGAAREDARVLELMRTPDLLPTLKQIALESKQAAADQVAELTPGA